MRSEAVEDYLKAIYELQERDGKAKTMSLAERLGVTAGSVSDMLKRLAKEQPPIVEYRLHQGVTLTPTGRITALEIIRRHRLLETFLHDVLGFAWEEVHTEADRLEHHISHRMTEAIANLLNHPDKDPHGDPIPDINGRLPENYWVPLSSIEPGHHVRISRVQSRDEELLKYLTDIGIGMETVVMVLEKPPFDGPLSLRIGPTETGPVIRLGRQITDAMMVEVISTNPPKED